MSGRRTPHEVINPGRLAPPVGFAHAVVSTPGRTVHLGGQTAHGADGRIAAAGLVEQFDAAAANLVIALEAAGARPEHLVSLQIFTTDISAYRDAIAELAEPYGRHLGRHYPAMALFGVDALYDPAANVELVGIAVVPDGPGAS
jgi:enamine deaminase RidA (YjgF/YER057c/UK114 family)